MSSLSVSLIQANLVWEDKASNLKMFGEKISALGPTEIVVLPEMFSTGFSMRPETLAETMDGETVTWMKRIAASKKLIITGSLIIEEDGNYYNRLIWMLPNQQYGYYDKRHLFAYAGEHEHYAAGSKRLIASVNGWKLNLQVCYDLRFPVWARQKNTPILSLEDEDDKEFGGPQYVGQSPETPEYDVLVYVANWPERRAHAWKTLLQARAIENQCYVVGVNRVGNDGNDIYHSGDSMIVDPMGEVLYTQSKEEFVYTATLDRKKLDDIRAKLPFLKDGDSFLIV
ncbi:MAG TPA: nitrilase family protein [Chitinophagaceae bacterium]|nr:nitrilase family protein [Chitinophagaceae bacterium]